MRNLGTLEKSAIREKVCEIGCYENTFTDEGYTPEKAIENFPFILNDEEIYKYLWNDWNKDDKEAKKRGQCFLVNLYDSAYAIEFKHIKFCGVENIRHEFIKQIRENFPYADTRKSLEERQTIFKNLWCFNKYIIV